MNKKTVAHRDIRKNKLWRNFFLLYSASLAALYLVLSVSSNAEPPSFDGSTSQIDTPSNTATSGIGNNLIPETQLAAYEKHKK